MENVGYSIIDSCSILGHTYVLGHSSTNPSPYVTWLQSSDGNYICGLYFTEEGAARRNLLQRAIARLSADEQDNLIQSLLSEELSSSIASTVNKGYYLEDMESSLREALNHLGAKDSTFTVLMERAEFSKQALEIYENHVASYDRKALADKLESLVANQYPELLPNECIVVHKISPEEQCLQNEFLKLTSDEIFEKYGPFDPGTGLLQFHYIAKALRREVEIDLGIYPREDANSEPAVVITLYAYHPDRVLIGSDTFTGVMNIEQIYRCKDKSDFIWGLDLHADERLRRIGQEYIFQTDSTDQRYSSHQGEKCTVIRDLTSKENDVLYSGMMWKVQFENGEILDAFDDELRHPAARKRDLAENPEQVKPGRGDSSLNAMIDLAESERNNLSAQGTRFESKQQR